MTRAPTPTSIAGKPVGSVGYGLMGLTLWGTLSHEEAIKPMKAALEEGANFWNAGTFYGPPEASSLQLLKAYFTEYPEDASKVVLSVKGAYDAATRTPTCSRADIRASVEESLRILDGTKSIDLFECARVDPSVPIETSVAALAELIDEGKIGSYGLSEVGPETIRRAYSVLPPAAVEVELSLFSRHTLTKNGVADVCLELGIPLVGYSPLDRGWLTGQLKRYEDLAADDPRHMWPRFQKGAFEQNVKLADFVGEVARKKGVTSTQVAIAWVKQQGAIPIPGSRSVDKVRENCRADVILDERELAALQEKLDSMEVSGHRYPEGFHKNLQQ